MSNDVNERQSETFWQEGINGGLYDNEAELFSDWKTEHDGHGTVQEYLQEKEAIRGVYSQDRYNKLEASIAELGDSMNTILSRGQSWKTTAKNLKKENLLLRQEVKQIQQQLTEARIRIRELIENNSPDTFKGTLIDIVTPSLDR